MHEAFAKFTWRTLPDGCLSWMLEGSLLLEVSRREHMLLLFHADESESSCLIV